MKKLTLLIVLLVAVGMTAGFALEVKPSFTLTGSATMTWGVNLNTGGHTGFDNAGTASLTVNLIPADATDAHTGKGQIYGSISISNVELYWAGTDAAAAEGGGAPTVSAQVFMPPFEIGVNAAPAMYTDAAAVIEAAALTGNTIVDAVMQADASFYGATGIYTTSANRGTYVKYSGNGFWVKADMASKGNWTTNNTDSYAFGGEFGATLGPVTLSTGLFDSINWGTNPLAGYIKGSFDIPGVGPASVGMDYQVVGSAFTWEAGAKAQYNFNKDATAYVMGQFYYDPAGAQGFDSKFALMVPAATLVGPVNFDVTYYLLDVAATKAMDMAAIANLGYKMALQGDMYVQPMFGLNFSNDGTLTKSMMSVNPKVVLGLAASPATTLTVGWLSGDILATAKDMGALTAALKVTY